LRLHSQLAKHWRAFEAAVVSARLTENAPLMSYGNEPRVEQGIAVVNELWDLLSHRRRGRFDGADGLEMLARQADATAELVQGLTPSETPPAYSTATPPAGTAAKEKDRTLRHPASVNARMLETIQANPEAMGWNSAEWAKHLKCAKSSVVETPTWINLKMGRERARAERARDRRRRSKGSDQRRD
jgi:hypothetical protein